jgi:WD40 repeat protein
MYQYLRTVFAAACLTAALTSRAAAADPPRDAYGDALPPGAVARLGSARLRHAANGLTWAPDGKTFATAGSDGAVRAWDAADGRELCRFRAPQQFMQPMVLSSVIFLPDGNGLAAVGSDGAIHVWDRATGCEIRTLSQPMQPATRLARSPDDGALCTVGIGNICRVVDLTTGKTIRQLGSVGGMGPTQAALSADGRRFATWSAGANDLLTVWDAADGKELFHAATGMNFVNGLTFSPDDKTLAVFGGNQPQFVTWDVDTGKELRRYESIGYVGQAAFSPNGKYVAAQGADRVIRLWGLASGKQLRQFEPPASNAAAVIQAGPLAFSPDGKKLAACHGTAVRLWDVEAEQELDEFIGHAGEVDDLHFSPDGRRLLSCGKDGTAQLWDVAMARQLAAWTGPQTGMFFAISGSPDGKTAVAVAGTGLLRAELADGKVTDRILAPLTPGILPSGLVVSPDGRMLGAVGGDRIIHLWDIATGKETARLPSDPSAANPVLAFSPDGMTLAAAAINAPVRLLDAHSGKELRQLDAAAEVAPPVPGLPAPITPVQLRNVIHLRFSPDGRNVLCVTGGELSLWETATGRDRMRIVRTNVNLTRATFSPAGDLVAAGSTTGMALILDARTGCELTRLEGGHGGKVSYLTFSPDGKTLASGGADGGIVIWDLKEWVNRPVQTIELKPKRLPGLWKDLIDGDGGRAYRAVLALAASPKTAAPYLKERLAGAPGDDEKRIAQLIKDLNDDQFEVREAAQKELDKMGELALPALQKALDSNPPPETRRRAQEILDRRKQVVVVTEDVRTMRAVEALERSGAAEAVEVLRTLAKDAPNIVVKSEAAAALDRLGRLKAGS